MGTLHKAGPMSTWWPRLMSLLASRALARGLEYFFTESTVAGVSSMACCTPAPGSVLTRWQMGQVHLVLLCTISHESRGRSAECAVCCQDMAAE